MHKHVSSPRSAPARPLKRGKACLTCRFLKIRCDGARPICGPCESHPKDDPCEYADGPGRSRTRVLEESVARLEARLRELEQPELATPSVTLHHPYTTQSESPQTVPSSLGLSTPTSGTLPSPESLKISPLSPFSATTTLATNSPLPRTHPNLLENPIPSSDIPSATFSEGSVPRSPLSEDEEPPLSVVRRLFDNFIPYATDFGFFLDFTSFTNRGLSPAPIGNTIRPTPALLRAVYLWGAHLSENEAEKALEETFLTQALRDVSTNLLSPHEDRHIETLQSHVLLGYYFWRLGRCLEAMIHISAAASLVLACGFHKLRARPESSWNPSPFARASNAAVVLPSSRTAVEEGEKINALWAVFILAKSLSASVDIPSPSVLSIFDYGAFAIDTPWPLDMESYKENLVPQSGDATIQKFWNYSPRYHQSEGEAPRFESLVKATLIYHQAVQTSSYYRTDMLPNEQQIFHNQFQTVFQLLNDLKQRIPALSKLDMKNPRWRITYLTSVLLEGAIIRLHRLYPSDEGSRQHCLSAARAITRYPAAHLEDFGKVLNPMAAAMLNLACEVYISEAERIRSAWTASSQDAAQSEKELFEDIQQTMDLLSHCSGGDDLMSPLDRCLSIQSTEPSGDLAAIKSSEEELENALFPVPNHYYDHPVARSVSADTYSSSVYAEANNGDVSQDGIPGFELTWVDSQDPSSYLQPRALQPHAQTQQSLGGGGFSLDPVSQKSYEDKRRRILHQHDTQRQYETFYGLTAYPTPP